MHEKKTHMNSNSQAEVKGVKTKYSQKLRNQEKGVSVN